jgi:hypothetical protein
MKARKRPWRNPLDDPATYERIVELLGALSRDPHRLHRYEMDAPEDERELIMLLAARPRPKDAANGIPHVVACMLSLSWQHPEHYGPTAPADVRRSNQIQVLLGESSVDNEQPSPVRISAANHLLDGIVGAEE